MKKSYKRKRKNIKRSLSLKKKNTLRKRQNAKNLFKRGRNSKKLSKNVKLIGGKPSYDIVKAKYTVLQNSREANNVCRRVKKL